MCFSMIFKEFLSSDPTFNVLITPKFLKIKILQIPSADVENIPRCPLCQIFRPLVHREVRTRSANRSQSRFLLNPVELTVIARLCPAHSVRDTRSYKSYNLDFYTQFKIFAELKFRGILCFWCHGSWFWALPDPSQVLVDA